MVMFPASWGFWPGGMMNVSLLWLVLWVIALIFWVVMIIDVAQRRFRNNVEKIIWLIVVIFGFWVGALVYMIVIRAINPQGVYTPDMERDFKSSFNSRRRKR